MIIQIYGCSDALHGVISQCEFVEDGMLVVEKYLFRYLFLVVGLGFFVVLGLFGNIASGPYL